MASPPGHRRLPSTFETFTLDDVKIALSELKLGAKLGRGNFATVFLGSFQGKQVAVKQQHVDKDTEHYLMDELTVLKCAQQPPLLPLHACVRRSWCSCR